MNVLILGPAPRNASIQAHLLANGCRCSQTEARVSSADLHAIDWIIVNGYAPILKPDAIAHVGNRVINVHPSHLPYGRGIFPLFWTLFHGWPTGVSLHLIDEGIDTGPLLARKRVEPAGPHETLRTFNQRLLDEAAQLLIDSWAGIVSGHIQPQPQEAVPSSLVFKTRTQSETFVELLPDLWETPLHVVRELGNCYRGNLSFLHHASAARTPSST